MSDPADFTKLVPGFDFLQGLVKNAGAALPGIGQWVAPTLNPEELEKRIGELRTVQFWLEQNARMLGATIQALEVQRMTLSTLKTMNVQMSDLRDALTIRSPVAAPQPAAEAEPDEAEADTRDSGHGADTAEATQAAAPAAARPAAALPGAVDPMQWWGALTQQFTQLAASALHDNAAAVLPERTGAAAKAAARGPGAAAVAVKKSTARAPRKPAAAPRAKPAKPAAR